ncbi:MAG: DUF4238 domain-containing protein [Nitrososphaerales archaeon]
MNEPRLQHYIPRFYLSGFADPNILGREKRQVIWVYERGRDPRRSSPEREARKRDFYTCKEDGSRSVDVEIWFGKLEEQVAPIIASLMRVQRHITETEKQSLALFIGTMHMRTPAQRRLSETRVEPFVTKLMKEVAADNGKFRKFVEENPSVLGDQNYDVEELRQAILAGRGDDFAAREDYQLMSIIEVGKMEANVLLNMNWQTVYSEDQDLFLTSDDPVVAWVVDEPTNKLHLRMGIGSPGVNVWFPLCRTICLRINKNCETGYGSWVNPGIRYVNKITAMCADRWVYASKQSKEIKGLFDKKGGRVSVDTVDLRFEGRKY